MIQPEARPNRFVITGTTPQATPVDLFFDMGYGITPDQLSRRELPGAPATSTILIFPLPAGTLYGLRLDPGEHDKPSYWENAEIQAEDGRVLQRFAPSDFIGANQIDSLATENGRLRVTPTANAFDPSLFIRLVHPVPLPVDSRGNNSLQLGLRPTQRIIAFFLGLAGAAIAVGVVRKKNAHNAAHLIGPSRLLETCVLLYAALSIVFFRRPSLFLAPQMFFEDGVIFFHQQWQKGFEAIFIPYAGYLHLVPRLAAWASSFLPVSVAPWLFFMVGLSSVLATVLKAASPRVGFPYAYWCALVVLCQPNGDEIMAILTNVHWWAGVILLLVGLSSAPRTRGQLTRDLLAVALAGLSGPWAVLCAPLFLFRLWQRRTWSQLAIVVLLLVTASIQMHFNLAGVPALTPEYFTTHALRSVAGLGFRLGGQLIGYHPNYYSYFLPSATHLLSIRPWEIVAFFAWLIVLVAIPVRKFYFETRCSFIAFALIMVASTIVRTNGWEYMLFDLMIDQRYVFIPLLLTYWLVIIAIDNSGWRRSLSVAFLALIVIRNADNFRMPPVVDFHWSRYAPQLEKGEAVTIPVFPAGWNIKFEAKVDSP